MRYSLKRTYLSSSIFREKSQNRQNPTVAVECIYMVIPNNSECDVFELIAEFWPYIRSGVLVQTNLLGKDFARWLPLRDTIQPHYRKNLNPE